MKIYASRDRRRGPDTLFDPDLFAPLWSEFQKWTDSEDLVACWHEQWDGGGMDSWWRLRLEPKQPASQAAGATQVQ